MEDGGRGDRELEELVGRQADDSGWGSLISQIPDYTQDGNSTHGLKILKP